MSTTNLVEIQAQFKLNCGKCGRKISVGSAILWDREHRIAYHVGCAQRPESAAVAAPAQPVTTNSTLVEMRARFNSECPTCSKRIRYDDRMMFDTDARIAYHVGCVPAGAGRSVAAEPQTMRCRRCGVSGAIGQYPFSTNPSSGLCDDCGA